MTLRCPSTASGLRRESERYARSMPTREAVAWRSSATHPGVEFRDFSRAVENRDLTPLAALSLHAARRVAADEAIHLGDGDAVEVPGDRLLERARRDGEAQRVGGVRPVTSP